MQPTTSSLQAVDPVLTNMLVGYLQSQDRFVASQAFPPVATEKDSGTYYLFTKKYWSLDAMKYRAPGGHFARSGYGVSSTTFATVQWGLEHPIPRENRANSQVPLDLETAGVSWLSQMSLIRKERAFSADFMKSSVWGTTDSNSATDWDDFVSGDPVTNVQYTTPGTLANVRQILANVLDVQSLLVSKATYNTANEGQTYTGGAIIDDDCLVCNVASTPGIMTASAGYTFNWAGGGGMGAIAPMYYENQTKSDVIQISEQWDQKVVASDVGYIFLDIV
jgi:hypothetical protein